MTAKQKFRKCGFMLTEVKKDYDLVLGDLVIYTETQSHAGRDEPRTILKITSNTVVFDITDWHKEWSPAASYETLDAIKTQMEELNEELKGK
jgi:hypothetical protein